MASRVLSNRLAIFPFQKKTIADMRSVGTLERLETALGKPVVPSNLAMIFAALAHLGLPRGSIRCGRIFDGYEAT